MPPILDAIEESARGPPDAPLMGALLAKGIDLEPPPGQVAIPSLTSSTAGQSMQGS